MNTFETNRDKLDLRGSGRITDRSRNANKVLHDQWQDAYNKRDRELRMESESIKNVGEVER